MAASQSEKEHRFWNAVGLLLFVGLCAISFALIFSYAHNPAEVWTRRKCSSRREVPEVEYL